jgi:hypothetical protein
MPEAERFAGKTEGGKLGREYTRINTNPEKIEEFNSRFFALIPRNAIDNYLQFHRGKQGVVRLGGSGTAWSYIVRIGTEPSLCGTSRVYIALNFNSTGQQDLAAPPGDPSDVLKDIRFAKTQDCL